MERKQLVDSRDFFQKKKVKKIKVCGNESLSQQILIFRFSGLNQ